MTVAWYNEGARVLDVSGLTGITVGGTQLPGTASGRSARRASRAATPGRPRRPRSTRSRATFYLYAKDIERGLDIWRFRGDGAKPSNKGRWMSGPEAQARFAADPVPLTDSYRLFCLAAQ